MLHTMLHQDTFILRNFLHYPGDASDTLDVEIYQPWLEPATKEQLEQQQAAARSARQTYLHQEGHETSAGGHSHGHGADHVHEHGGGHHHQHGSGVIDHGDHVHEERTQVGTWGWLHCGVGCVVDAIIAVSWQVHVQNVMRFGTLATGSPLSHQ